MEGITNKKSIIVTGLAITIFMFLLNCMTKYAADDYCYQYNLADGSAVNNIFDVFRALYDHYMVHSGRVFAHFFVYIFLLLPKIVFNFCGAAIFALQIVLIYIMAKGKKEKHNVIILSIIFSLIWLYEPAFGQVNLWLTGACNYLFGITIAVGYFCSFVLELYEIKKTSISAAIAWCLFSFIFGGYSENISFCVAFGAVLILIWIRLVEKRKVGIFPILKIVFALAGYAFMILAPSTLERQAGNYSLSYYVYNIKNVIVRFFAAYRVPLLIFAGALVIAIYLKVNRKRIYLACVCVIVSICSSLMLFVASYISDRSLAASMVFLTLGIAILLYDIWESRYQLVAAILTGCVAVLLVEMLVVGVYDIMWTYNKTARREAYLKECAAKGQQEVVVERINAKTRYSSSYRLPELDSVDQTAYPNQDYEKYYRIESILSEEMEDEE